jgi:hypothetical protein
MNQLSFAKGNNSYSDELYVTYVQGPDIDNFYKVS